MEGRLVPIRVEGAASGTPYGESAHMDGAGSLYIYMEESARMGEVAHMDGGVNPYIYGGGSPYGWEVSPQCPCRARLSRVQES